MWGGRGGGGWGWGGHPKGPEKRKKKPAKPSQSFRESCTTRNSAAPRPPRCADELPRTSAPRRYVQHPLLSPETAWIARADPRRAFPDVLQADTMPTIVMDVSVPVPGPAREALAWVRAILKYILPQMPEHPTGDYENSQKNPNHPPAAMADAMRALDCLKEHLVALFSGFHDLLEQQVLTLATGGRSHVGLVIACERQLSASASSPLPSSPQTPRRWPTPRSSPSSWSSSRTPSRPTAPSTPP